MSATGHIPTADVAEIVQASAAAVNIAARLTEFAARHPDKPAVIVARRDGRYDAITFAELELRSAALAAGFARIGIARGDRTLVLLRPGHDFFAVTFALLRKGAVPVLIDPGMGRRNLIDCLAGVEASAFIGIPLAHVMRLIYRRRFASLKVVVTAGRRWFWGGQRLNDLCEFARRDDPQARVSPSSYASASASASPNPAAHTPTTADDVAAILFTSGSTGPAKGVVYTHGIFDAQVRYLNSVYGYTPEEVDLATFPLFALFDAALGMTAVIPHMDATRPGFVDPRRILAAVRDHRCTHMFGSPALLERVGRYAAPRGEKLATMKRVITAGAPLAPANLTRFRQILPESAEIFTPYGATEALPVASIESREILNETAARTAAGAGVCVGKPLPGVDVRIITISDDPLAGWETARVLPPDEIGEICVRGPIVTREYFRKPLHTQLAKIPDDHAADVWHRMGDVGYRDERGRLWFCGRKAHRVTTPGGVLFTIPVEQIFNQHPAVYRTALVGVGEPGSQTPVLCVEKESGQRRYPDARLIEELRTIGRQHALTRDVGRFLIHPRFPVDVRHNAKIFREQLARWAAGRIRRP